MCCYFLNRFFNTLTIILVANVSVIFFAANQSFFYCCRDSFHNLYFLNKIQSKSKNLVIGLFEIPLLFHFSFLLLHHELNTFEMKIFFASIIFYGSLATFTIPTSFHELNLTRNVVTQIGYYDLN